MTNSAPPHMPPPQAGPPPDKTPGFLLCGLAVFVGLGVVGAITGGIMAAVGDAAWVNAAVSLSVVLGVIMASIKNPRFGKCLAKGLVTVLAVSAVLVGACFALLASSGL